MLNEEHAKHSWLDLKELIKLIKWEDDKKLLKSILEKGMNGKVYFKLGFAT